MRARGGRWEGEERKRGSQLFSRPIVPRALTIFNCCFFLTEGRVGGVPSGILCGGEKLTVYRLYVFYFVYIFRPAYTSFIV